MSEHAEGAPLIDIGELEERLGSDNELLAQIVELFAERGTGGSKLRQFLKATRSSSLLKS